MLAPLSLFGATATEVMQELKATKYVEPVFPESLRLEGVAEGQVTLGLSRTAAGGLGDILVLDATHPKFEQAAVKAVREWRFAPAATAADLAPRIVCIGFRLAGVVILPSGRAHPEQLAHELDPAGWQRPVPVPRLESLSPVPKALAQPMPAYPGGLAGSGREGTVAVKFYVDKEGRARLPEVIEATAPEFAAAALAALGQWRYEPPQSGGRPVVASDHWEFKFRPSN